MRLAAGWCRTPSGFALTNVRLKRRLSPVCVPINRSWDDEKAPFFSATVILNTRQMRVVPHNIHRRTPLTITPLTAALPGHVRGISGTTFTRNSFESRILLRLGTDPDTRLVTGALNSVLLAMDTLLHDSVLMTHEIGNSVPCCNNTLVRQRACLQPKSLTRVVAVAELHAPRNGKVPHPGGHCSPRWFRTSRQAHLPPRFSPLNLLVTLTPGDEYILPTRPSLRSSAKLLHSSRILTTRKVPQGMRRITRRTSAFRRTRERTRERNDSDRTPRFEPLQEHPVKDRFLGASFPATQNRRPGSPAPSPRRTPKGVALQSMPSEVSVPEDGFHECNHAAGKPVRGLCCSCPAMRPRSSLPGFFLTRVPATASCLPLLRVDWATACLTKLRVMAL